MVPMSSLSNEYTYRSPSNIALVKYWGKKGRQLPINPSLSITLRNCYTDTHIKYHYTPGEGKLLSFNFEGNIEHKFQSRIQNFLDSIEDVLPELKDYQFHLSSNNSFPHSAGIASSASAMSALAACLVKMCSPRLTEEEFRHKASIVARLASGSASRSIYSNLVLWGETKFEMGSNEYAIEFTDYHEDFKDLQDTILIVSSDEKSVSSSLGHSMMNSHPYKEVRELQAHENMRSLVDALRNGDFDAFGEVVENEALTLHSLMMTSSPSFVLLKPNSLRIIELVRSFREHTNLPVYFTIDAGPNIHLIYPKKIKDKVADFITSKLKPCCESIINDEAGVGTYLL